ncbi:MAG: succinate dehydrogenase, hydrophobic membrane anchor protein [Desulfovermiculus sp.]|nr:succinate dehydrogenase, hydrophobic membrane anchor protein [Desulfovermiculus sp.]
MPANTKNMHTLLTDQWIPSRLENISCIGKKVKSNGWPYILAWVHRITGLLLILYLFVHIATLSSLTSPEAYEQKMNIFTYPLFMFLEWLLAVPVIYHALNGGRLLAYELLGVRIDSFLIRCVFYLSLIYVVFLGILMIRGDQTVSSFFFWFFALIISLILVFILYLKQKYFFKRHSILWSLQRITAILLLVLIPAHMLFNHLNVSMGHDPDMIIRRLNSGFIKFIDIVILLSILYHAAYGLFSISNDYLEKQSYKNMSSVVIVIVMLVFVYFGLGTIFAI